MSYIDELFDFLEELQANNNRPWFAANRDRYEALRAAWLCDIDKMIGAMTQWEPRLSGQSARSCAYRVYRDTRFSKDKTPYKPYFSAAISPWGRKAERAGFYIQTGLPGYVDNGLYAGIWCPGPAVLSKLRHAIVDNIEEFSEILTSPQFKSSWSEWVGDTLKTIPKGWERNHPCAELLRRKDYGKQLRCGKKFFQNPDWPEVAAEEFHKAQRFVEFLNYSIDE